MDQKEWERRHQKEQEAQCLLPPLCWLRVIIPRLPPQHLGASGPFLTLPTVLGEVVTSCGQQIRRTGSDRLDVTESAGNSVISEPHSRPLLPTNNLAFSHQVLDLSSGLSRNSAVVKAKSTGPLEIGHSLAGCAGHWVCLRWGRCRGKLPRFVSLYLAAFLSLTHPGSKESFSRWNF